LPSANASASDAARSLLDQGRLVVDLAEDLETPAVAAAHDEQSDCRLMGMIRSDIPFDASLVKWMYSPTSPSAPTIIDHRK